MPPSPSSRPSRSSPGPGSSTGAAETELVARLKRGEEAAYEELVRSFGGRLLLVARRLMKNEEDARDAFQEAMLAAFKAIGSFEGQSSIYTWLHRITVNAALMKLRSRDRRAEVAIETMLPQFTRGGHLAEPTTKWRDSAEAEAQRSELRDVVRDSVEKLPETYRTALILRDIEELSTKEVAETLGVTRNAVKIRVHRARMALRELLDPSLRLATP